jgi:(hydroxyamino)benzene mutase
VETSQYRQRLLWHGFFLFFLGLLSGFAVPMLTNPRMGVSAHLEGVMNGIFLSVLGLVWQWLVLSARSSFILFALALYGAYANWFTTLLAAILGTSRRTPIAGSGFTGQPWHENVVEVALMSLTFAIAGACVIALWGLRTRRPLRRLDHEPGGGADCT